MKLNEKYNQDSFIDFIDTFLPEDFKSREEDIIIKKDRYKEITKAKILGFCESLDLHVLEMDHTHDKDPRVAIATDAFKILADHWIHRALVIFKNNDSENYRFSYLTITLDLNDKNKVIKKYSNARRYSFYLGANAKVKTPEQQLVKKGKVKDINDLLGRFSVEVVNKQFYLEVAKFFDELVSTEVHNLVLPSISESDLNIRKSFAVRLIGRMMFCWFLKQKKSDNGQLIPDELLSSKIVSDNYYHNILEPLFFGVLNTSIDSRDIRSELFDKVPYLNGGLFNPQTDDYYEMDRGTFTSKFINTLKISDKWFKEFFELLETYNFTIDENTVFDQELSVDPEMLGRIFENLLAEINPETGSSERKRTGSFYTPRQIVEYMVDQSLIEYFKTKTSIDINKLSAVVSYDLTDDTEYPLSDIEKQELINAIESLKILDPACGSGAYPIGTLQKIVYILQQIDPDCTLWLEKKLQGVPDLYKQKIINEVKQNPFDYTRKLDVIKNSIFGVDIQPVAVDVSRLRCFLTLVVESEIDDKRPNRGIEPLPNLDFKFVCANTLISLPKSENTGLFDDHSGIIELSKIMSEYFSCNSQRKNEIKLKFSSAQKDILEKTISAFGRNTGELTLKLTTWNPFSNHSNSWFDPEWMFGLQEKFDVVIGNPPYVNIANIEDELFRKTLQNQYVTVKNKSDLYSIFTERGYHFLKEKGVLSYIFSNSWLNTSSFELFRKFLIENTKVIKLVKCPPGVFENATVTTVIILLSREKVSNNDISLMYIDDKQFKDFEYNLTYDRIKRTTGFGFSFDKEIFFNVKTEELDKVVKFSLGIKTSDDGRFIKDQNNGDDCFKVIRGKDIAPYYIPNSVEKYIWYKPNLMLEKKGAGPRSPEIFNQDKILFQDVATRITAVFDDRKLFTTDTLSVIYDFDQKIQPKYLLGLLNSNFLNTLYSNWFPTGLHIKINELKKLPIAIAETSLQNKIKDSVEKIIKLTQENGYNPKAPSNEQLKLQEEIDEMVMDIYGLSIEQKNIIRKS